MRSHWDFDFFTRQILSPRGDELELLDPSDDDIVIARYVDTIGQPLAV